ncbi:MAG: ComEA family DNA-binding protein [Eggerthellaceae bacterium]|nr:ComEA family DNA-binding protein [Eggerthellaceae bacterium]
MPFVESSQSLKAKLHLSSVSTPVLAGIVALFIVTCALAVHNVSYVLGEDAFAVVAAHDDAAGGEAAGNGAAQTAQACREGISAGDGADDTVAQQDGTNDGGEQSAEGVAVVFVSGSVLQPGVYELGEHARVQEAVDAAGGFSEDASTDSVNLARIVQDGEQIDIPSLEDVANGIAPLSTQTISTDGGATPSQESGLVNVNTADAAQLEGLPGIGEVTAGKIISSREQDGAFASKEDIMRVSGIGQKKFEAIEDLITV